MNNEQNRLLSKMKKLIKEGKRCFQNRDDRDYLGALLELGITEDEAWNQMLTLNSHFWVQDLKPSYLTTGKSLIFIKEINGIQAYIKLKIETPNKDEEVVWISFHKNNDKNNTKVKY